MEHIHKMEPKNTSDDISYRQLNAAMLIPIVLFGVIGCLTENLVSLVFVFVLIAVYIRLMWDAPPNSDPLGCFGGVLLLSATVVLSSIFMICDACGWFLLIPIASGLACAVMLFRRKALSYLPVIAALFFASLPHAIFLITANTAPDPTDLVPIARSYEAAAISLHLFLEPVINLAWFWWLPILLAAAIQTWLSRGRLLGRVLVWRNTMEAALLAVIVVSSLTVFTQAPGAAWSANIRSRIRIELAAQMQSRLEFNVEQVLQENLAANSRWRTTFAQHGVALRRLQVPAAAPDAENTNSAMRLERRMDALHSRAAPTAEETVAQGFGSDVGRQLAADVDAAIGPSFRKAAVASPNHANEPPPNIDTLHRLHGERVYADLVEAQTRAALSRVVTDALLGGWSQNGLVSSVARGFVDTFVEDVTGKLLARVPDIRVTPRAVGTWAAAAWRTHIGRMPLRAFEHPFPTPTEWHRAVAREVMRMEMERLKAQEAERGRVIERGFRVP
ncbi:MAG TPA: hypothetical protein VNU97_08455 [Rhizomicrobium sp.]|jgi:hypothetical protein|nr:hypothetical protein [Rhizomicrobium sp.]